MLRALPYILLGAVIYSILFYMENYQPELMNDLLIQVDVFGITRVAELEHQRLIAIKDLTIPYEEKQVLINRTVFMGASTSMVELALGKPEPKNIFQRMWDEKKEMLTYYVYYLPGDKRPTVLTFEDDKLIDARKGSALDFPGSK